MVGNYSSKCCIIERTTTIPLPQTNDISMDYSEKLKRPEWQKKRLKILDRDNWECRFCDNKPKSLHIHHTKYSKGEPWEIEDQYLITLCEDCHNKEHSIRQLNEKLLIRTIREKGFSADQVQAIARGFLALEMIADPEIIAETIEATLSDEKLIESLVGIMFNREFFEDI